MAERLVGRRANRRYCRGGSEATFNAGNGRRGARTRWRRSRKRKRSARDGTYVTRRSALTIIAAGGASIASGRAWAEDKPGRVIYPVAVPVYQTQFLADRLGYFKRGRPRLQADPGRQRRQDARNHRLRAGRHRHRRYHRTRCSSSNRGRNGRVLMPVDTRSSSVMFIIRKDLWDQGITSLEKLTEWKRPDGRKADRLGVVAGRHQPCLVVLLHGDDGARPESHLDRHRQCRHHAGLAEDQAGRCPRQFAVAAQRSRRSRAGATLLFDGTDETIWNKYIGGKVPVTAHFTLQATIDKDPPKMQAFVTAIWRATQWIRKHSPDEIYDTIEPYVGSTSRAANILEITALQRSPTTMRRSMPRLSPAAKRSGSGK